MLHDYAMLMLVEGSSEQLLHHFVAFVAQMCFISVATFVGAQFEAAWLAAADGGVSNSLALILLE